MSSIGAIGTLGPSTFCFLLCRRTSMSPELQAAQCGASSKTRRTLPDDYSLRSITLAPKKLILTRRASEGSASEPSLARRVSMCKDAKLSCRGNTCHRLEGELAEPLGLARVDQGHHRGESGILVCPEDDGCGQAVDRIYLLAG